MTAKKSNKRHRPTNTVFISLTDGARMRRKSAIFSLVFIFWLCAGGQSAEPGRDGANQFTHDVFKVSLESEYAPAQPESKFALLFVFQMEKGWHFYARPESAPGGMNLKFNLPEHGFIKFHEAKFPESETYYDEVLKQKVDVFSDKFRVTLPFSISGGRDGIIETSARIGIEGAYCSEEQCRIVRDFVLDTKIRISGDKFTLEAKKILPESQKEGIAGSNADAARGVLKGRDYSVWFALGLAFLAGLALNIMPCVWPVLPIIVMRIVAQARESKGRSIALGIAFCLGILLFFACLAGANIILQLVYGTVLQWGDQFRNPAFVGGMATLLVVMALFMFGVFTVVLPASVTGKAGSGKGLAGSTGMGFLAAILSTPCSFGILVTAFGWAQTQRLAVGTLSILVIGLGMAAPYAILTSMPGLLARLPKAGRWMELVKQGIGFVLLGLAVWLIGAMPEARRMGVAYFALVMAFGVWMWGRWVGYDTKGARKWAIRIIAIALAAAAGWAFLREPVEIINWQGYDSGLIEQKLKEEKPILIKFTADWCMSCRVVEKMVYGRNDIAKLIKEKGVLAIKADTTRKDSAATLVLKDVYNEPGVPVSMLFLPGQKEPVKWYGKFFADELKRLLEGVVVK
ncbi:MAG: protein-disulfide reductase DsbD family protein [Planctomycetota bacterium]